MRIAWETATFTVALEADEIMFYASSTKRKEIDYIKTAFSNISKEEEENLKLTLKEMFVVKKPCGDVWKMSVGGKMMMFYLNGYQIEVTTA